MSASAPFAARYDSIDDEGDQPFWLYEPDGNPLRLSPRCAGFQVRFWSPVQRGTGSIVVDEYAGRLLILPRSASPDDFCDRVGWKVGRYRLFPVDEVHERIDCAPAQFEITAKMAEARGASAPSSSGAGLAGDPLLAQLLAMVRESQAQALATQAQTMDQMSTMYRAMLAMQTEAQKTAATHGGAVVDAVADILRAAGESGTVTKSTALAAAAAGAPVIIHTPANGNAAGASSSSEAPRNAAPAASSAEGLGHALASVLVPLAEKLAPMAAYGMGKKLDLSDEDARSMAGFVGDSAKVAAMMLRDDPAAPTAGGAVERAPVAPVDLLQHAMRIQGALDGDDRAWVLGKLGAHRHLLDDLKGAVARLTVEEGAATVRALRGCEAMLTPAERAIFDLVVGTPGKLPMVFGEVVGRSAEDAADRLRVVLFRTRPVEVPAAAPVG